MEGVMKQNSVGISERVKENILILSRKSGPGDYPRSICGVADFHLIDLKTNNIHSNHAPSLILFDIPTSMLAVDDFVYVYASRRTQYQSEVKELDSLRTLYHNELFFNGVRLHLDPFNDDKKRNKEWYPAPIPAENRNFLRCTSLMDKIYVFGDDNLAPEVLDPVVGHWKQLFLPSHLVGCTKSCYELPDPSNRRILLHLSGGQLPSPTIYAFTPNDNDFSGGGGDWKPIVVNAHYWTHVAAVVDNIIYFHSHKFTTVARAFDLATEAWLEVHWESSFDDGIDMNNIRYQFDTMFHLADNILCLAVWTPKLSKYIEKSSTDRTEIVFRKFRVERSGATVKLLPLPSYTFILPATSKVYAFLPV